MRSRFGYGAGCRCAGPETIVSEPCEFCQLGTTPYQVQAQIPALANIDCTSCSALASTHILTQLAGNDCSWYLAVPAAGLPCVPMPGASLNEVQIRLNVTTIRETLSWRWVEGLTTREEYRWSIVRSFGDTCAWAGKSLPFLDQTFGLPFRNCSAAGTNAIITAL